MAKGKATGSKVTIRLSRAEGSNANQTEFFSVNGKNYLIKRGENVEVPKEVAEVIQNGYLAEDFAFAYVDKTALNEAK